MPPAAKRRHRSRTATELRDAARDVNALVEESFRKGTKRSVAANRLVELGAVAPKKRVPRNVYIGQVRKQRSQEYKEMRRINATTVQNTKRSKAILSMASSETAEAMARRARWGGKGGKDDERERRDGLDGGGVGRFQKGTLFLSGSDVARIKGTGKRRKFGK